MRTEESHFLEPRFDLIVCVYTFFFREENCYLSASHCGMCSVWEWERDCSYMRLLLETALLELSNDTQEIQNQHESSEILGLGQCFVG